MTPRIVVRYFGPGQHNDWARLVRVLEHTARRHCPDWDLDLVSLTPEPANSPLGLQSSVVNTQKLDAWADAVLQAADGDRLLLMDADTAILRPLTDIWERPFDVAYTTKPEEARFPFNAGILFLLVSPAVQAFITAWRDVNRQMLDDPALFQMWRPRYGGLNQTAFGYLLINKYADGLRRVKLPCVEWNCEDDSWAAFDPHRTRIVHYKGELYRALFARTKPSEEMRPLLRIWHALEAATSEPVEQIA